MNIRNITTALLLTCSLFSTNISAKIQLCPLFTDNMVLQQESHASVWGTATPGSGVTIATSWNGARYKVEADSEGKWMTKVSTPKAGGPHTVTITEAGCEPVIIQQVLIGEVWICSGQSNMEMPVKGDWAQVLDSDQELEESTQYPNIRFLTVQKEITPQPIEHFKADEGGWMICSPQTLKDFSATAYFFGREIHRQRNVPVGLIDTSWGGSVIESWMTKEALVGVKDLGDQAEMIAKWPANKEDRKSSWVAQEQWQQFKRAFDEIHIAYSVFATEFEDDSEWDSMKVPGALETVYPDFNGHLLLRKEVDIPASWSGQTLTFHANGIDDNDVTYYNGKKIGEGKAWNAKREYTIPAELVKEGNALLAIRVMDNSGIGGVNGSDASLYLEGADGEKIQLAGYWNSKKDADYSDLPDQPINTYNESHWSTLIYNAMVHPLIPYAMKGVIWYQGCSNTERAYQYRDLMQLMIDDWRREWGTDFPFYITQLANYKSRQTDPGNSDWAELREAQSLAAKVVPNTGLAVTIDIGEANDIHPRNKQEVGRRLALQALNKTYGMSMECSGPVYESHEIDGNVVRIKFSAVGKGLVAKDGKLEGFAVAGADRKFHWGVARIVGDCVEVTCKNVTRPLTVRYAWADNPLGNLYNQAGLPASPFRTDDWQGVTLKNTSRF